jgi:hypothetical protein
MFDPSSNDLKRAVRDLRAALGKTQSEFGALIGKGLATVQRYEGVVPPKGKVLGQLAALALENSQLTLAALFRSALDEELGGLQASVTSLRMQQHMLQAIGLLTQLENELPMPEEAIKKRTRQAVELLRSGMKEGDKLRTIVSEEESEDSQ